jgi:hypothetical protein
MSRFGLNAGFNALKRPRKKPASDFA